MDKLDVCKNTREIASDTFYKVLKEILLRGKEISETSLRDKWWRVLKEESEIFPECWYIPPPHGIEMLFGTSQRPQRLSARSIRPQEFWPKDDILLDKKDGLITFYAGPVNKETGLIGDFGLTVYLGQDSEIITHLKKVKAITEKIAQNILIGMKLKDIFNFAYKTLKKNDLTSDLLSSTDPAGTNIGHTIPWSYEEMTIDEKSILNSAEKSWIHFKDLINKKRKFISGIEELVIKPGMAITVEPRPKSLVNASLPAVWFHTTVLFKEDGKIEILTNFDKIFKLTGMNYMLDS